MAKQKKVVKKVKKPNHVKKKVVKKEVVKKDAVVKSVVKTVVKKAKVVKKEKVVKKVVKKVTKKKPAKKVKKTPQVASKPAAVPAVAAAPEAIEEEKPKSTKVPQAFASFSEEQYKVYCQTLKEWEDKSNDQIKKELQRNNQSRTGNKKELLAKLADGVALGQIPRCPECFGGRPKFDPRKGTYHCSGYMDDIVFKNCHKNFTLETLQRLPWAKE